MLLLGDCLEELRKLDDNTIDLIVTDPPYGYSFMGKDWDKAVPPVAVWKECLRVLKDGAFCFVMSAPRQDVLSRMICNLSDAGFKTDFTSIYWTYACLSKDTEVLTEDGWKEWEQLHKNDICDRILVYDTEKEKYKFESPSTWNSYRIQEDMYRIESKETDQLVSRNHRVYTKQGFIFAENLKKQADMVYLSSLPSDIWNISSRSKKETKDCGNVLYDKLQTKNSDSEMYRTQQKVQYWWSILVRKTQVKSKRRHEGGKESCLEGWSNLFFKKGKLWEIQDKIYKMSQRIFSYGSQRWLCYGTQNIGSSTNWKTIIENRSNTSFGSQSRKQQNRKFDVIQNKQGTQTTRASVRKEFYDGIIYCPTVSTGCFIARRNGKIFLTGNSGFPKAGNIGKMIDKRGTENYRFSELNKELCDYLKMAREGLGLSQKDIAKHFLSKTGGLTGCVWNWENGANIPTMGQWEKLKGILKLADEKFITLIERTILKREEAEREIAKERKQMVGGNFTYVKYSGNADITLPATPQAKALDGSYAGYQPKPAVEIIIVCMKPLQKTDNEKVKLDFEQLRNLKRLLNEEQLQV